MLPPTPSLATSIGPVLETLSIVGTFVFAASGALAAARLRQTLVTFAFFALVTGVGGGTVRDLLIGAPVFWVVNAAPAMTCMSAALIVWFTPRRWWSARALDWLDAIGLAAFAVFGAAKAMSFGVPPFVAGMMGVVTGCVGGIMRGIRTVPHLWSICEDMLAVCPEAIMLQYVNPMAINCWALSELAPDIRHVGLCHSVQGTAFELSQDLGVDYKSLRYRCAGINHMAFYTKFERELPDGTREDLYPKLKEIAARGEEPGWNKVRYEMLRRTGYFVTESSEHFAEYVPWFIKRDRPDLIEKFNIPLDEYIRRCEEQIAAWEAQERDLVSANRLDVKFSGEYGAKIMRAIATGKPAVINGNVPNHGLIDNLPAGACVEVPCLVDGNGITPTRVGALPPHLTAMMQTNINVQALTLEAIRTGKREHVYHAAMMDPHTAAELSLDEIWSLVDDLIEAHGDWMPAFH